MVPLLTEVLATLPLRDDQCQGKRRHQKCQQPQHQFVTTGIDSVAQHAWESLKSMLVDDPKPSKSTNETQTREAGPRRAHSDASPRKTHSDFWPAAPRLEDRLFQDRLSQKVNAATELSCSTTVPNEDEVEELSFERANLAQSRQPLSMASMQSLRLATKVASTPDPCLHDLLAANALLKRQLMEAEEIQVPSAMATARACAADAEQLRKKNRQLEENLHKVEKALSSTISASSAQIHREADDLRAENMKLQQHLCAASQCAEESIELRNRLESQLTALAEENKNLRVQLTMQFKRCADAEMQREAQKQLFCKLFETAKHDMDQCDGDRGKAVTHRCDSTSETGSLAEDVSVSAPVLFIKCTEDESGDARVAHTPHRFLLPQRGSISPIQRYEGQRRTRAPKYEKSAAKMQPAESVVSEFVKSLDLSLSTLNMSSDSRLPSGSAKSAITPNFCRQIGRQALLRRAEHDSDRCQVERQCTDPSHFEALLRQAELQNGKCQVERQHTAPSQLETSYRKLLPLRASPAAEVHVRTAGR